MKIVYSDKHAQHDPQTFIVRGVKQRSAEQPERATRLLAAAKAPATTSCAPRAFGPGPAATGAYARLHRLPANRRARMGEIARRLPTRSCPTCTPPAPMPPIPRRWPAAPAGTRPTWPAQSARTPGTPPLPPPRSPTTAADLVLAGDTRRLCALPAARPSRLRRHGGRLLLPEQHAVAAQHLRSRHARVAVLDVDVHHGNGTQGIFYERADVLTVSIHADPDQLLSLLLGSRARSTARARATASISTCRCRSAPPTRRGSRPATRR